MLTLLTAPETRCPPGAGEPSASLSSRTKSLGFTLLEVLVSVGILATAFVALVGLETQSLATISRISEQFVADLFAVDAYSRYILIHEGYGVEPVHPRLKEMNLDFRAEVRTEPFTLENLPFVPVLPVGWLIDRVSVEVQGPGGKKILERSYLWAHKELQGSRVP